MKKILLLGSAPYITDWYEKNGQKYIQDGFILCALNNAWMVSPNEVRVWFKAEDFGMIKTSKIPSKDYESKWITISRWNDVPFFYTNRRGGTMLLNVLCHLINESFYNRERLFIAIAGSDLTYSARNSWFYGNGNPDPLNFSEQFIKESLAHIKYASECLGHTIVNVGGQDQSTLPFARFNIDDA